VKFFLFHSVVAAALLVAHGTVSASDQSRAAEAAVRAFAEGVAAGRDLSTLAPPGTVLAAEVPELRQLAGCRVDMIDSLVNGEYGVKWRCPRSMRVTSRTAAMVRVGGGTINRVIMSTMTEGY
jgi:hypothetical protein